MSFCLMFGSCNREWSGAYNARSETVMEKPSYRDAWYKSQFALIPVQTIYERYYDNGKSQRWGIHRKDGQPFTVAAIYEVAYSI